ncbi:MULTISPECIES: DUF2797 domain-containing protein [unclassified Saccharicrinis]|uniref:DUF2797 domain-containing protein n=1 Tax=unclassified Saccharicrinis TaxID=2646859 RepID=UPI003D3314BB
MKHQGNIIKMKSNLAEKVEYALPVGDELVALNEFINQKIVLTYLHQINCIACGKKTQKSFGQGFCYKCFMEAPEASECILHPDTCKAHLGISRDQEWANNHCLTPHVVYLAVSSNLKVGITRKTQIPTRWIDQGASKAIILAETPNRHIAGTIEKFLMQYYADKTNWQAMLKGKTQETDLLFEKEKACNYLPKELKQYCIADNTVTEIDFPVEQFPTKISSLSFDKSEKVEGTLTGIKGQYLILDNYNVINIRKHNGYKIEIETP